jgi:transposase-like protein
VTKLVREPFIDEIAALELIEAHVWPDGPICPHCGESGRIARLGGRSTRIGTYKCYGCRKPFTVKIGTILESSHVPMQLWLRAIYLLSTSPNQLSANRLHRALGITVRTASLMKQRIDGALLKADLAQAVTGAPPAAKSREEIGPRAIAIAMRARAKGLRGAKNKKMATTLTAKDGIAARKSSEP